jgi:hypothetical protein
MVAALRRGRPVSGGDDAGESIIVKPSFLTRLSSAAFCLGAKSLIPDPPK